VGRLSRQRGKMFELQVARYLGGKREHFEACDVVVLSDLRDPPLGLAIECKYRTKLPASIKKWYAQSVAAASASAKQTKGNRIPLVCMKERSQGASDALCVIRLEDLKTLIS
jgi:hypothetical protein